MSFHMVHMVGSGSVAASHMVWEVLLALGVLWGSVRLCSLWTPPSPAPSSVPWKTTFSCDCVVAAHMQAFEEEPLPLASMLLEPPGLRFRICKWGCKHSRC